MKVLAIDYGKKYVGLALSEGYEPYPLDVIKSKSTAHKLNTIKELYVKNNADRIIIGSGSRSFDKHIDEFIKLLEEKLKTKIIKVNEAFTSNFSHDYMKHDNLSQKNRRTAQHSYAAVQLIKRYLETAHNE